MRNAARDERKRLGQECSRLYDELNQAYKTQNQIFERNDATWSAHKNFMDECSRKIQFYAEESDREHNLMTYAFQQSQSAWSSDDKAGAKSFSDEGKLHQALMREAKEQKAYWVRQSQDAKYRYESNNSKADMDAAKARAKRLKDEFSTASEKLKKAKDEAERLDTEFENAKKAFQNRLDFLKAQWKVKSCEACGCEIRYHVDWTNIPKLCKNCKEKEKAKWKEIECESCKEKFIIYIDWANPPRFCKKCKERNKTFGTGEGGSRTSTGAVHAITKDGKDVTVSFGIGSKDGHTYIADDHIDTDHDFWGSKGNKGHDHFGPNGEPYADRGRYSD